MSNPVSLILCFKDYTLATSVAPSKSPSETSCRGVEPPFTMAFLHHMTSFLSVFRSCKAEWQAGQGPLKPQDVR